MFEGDEISSCSYMEGSITPPLSPKSLEDVNSPASKRQRVELFTDITAEDFTKSSVCFHCNKRGTGTSLWQPVSTWKPASDSYLASGSLSLTLLGDDPSDGSFLDLLTDLYGYKHVTASALFQQTKILFYLTRQKLSEFRRLTESKPFVQVGTGGVNSQVQWLHSQCCHFLQYVKVVIYRYYDPALALDPSQTLIEHFRNISEFPTSFLHHMGGLINHLGSLYVIQKKSLSKDLLHLHLDFHWSVVEILHIFHIKVKDLAVQSEVCQLFNTHLKTLLWDLVLIANTNHKNISSYQFHQSSIFPCHCFQELWILLLHLLDNRHQQLDTESFWCHIYSILHTVLSRQIPEEVSQHGVPTDSLESIDVQGLCWWLVLHMAPLYQYNEFGQITTNQTSVKNNWLMIQDLWKTAFSQDAIPEEGKVRCYLKCCIALSSYWDHNLIFVGTILERFHRRLNDTFHIPSLGLQDFTTNTKKTGGQWFEECFYRCKENDDDHLKIFNEKVNSYGLFLTLLALQLRKGMKSIGSKAWKQLKGRICSKFHQRGMQELSEIGMGHFMDLFLTLSMVVDVKEVGSRLCDFLDMLPSNNISPRKQIVIWKGLFALILNYEDKLVDIKGPAQKLAAQFNKISKEFSQLEGIQPDGTSTGSC
ncbi:protein MMS22-like [Ptychodera flava]|uniref:protein MMS22-like n=1 Tax=Ptychodera flava TaxID=63121 RepID=UPI00396A86F9